MSNAIPQPISEPIPARRGPRALITRIGARFVAAALVMVVGAGCFGGEGNVFSLEVGQCFDDPNEESEQISEVTIIDCADPHHNEVYAVFDLPGSDYPGDEVVFSRAEDGCVDRFEDYVGESFGANDLGATFLAPTRQSWDNSDDREVICYLFSRTGEALVGSARDSEL